MSIELLADEMLLRNQIAENMMKIDEAFNAGNADETAEKLIEKTGDLAHHLHMLLTKRGIEPRHHAYMIDNRGLQPDHPKFYVHYHPIEDLLAFIEDEHANDDPVDQTIGSKFSFQVYSRRWGHPDTYTIIRTENGWNVSHLAINGECDKGGQPFLFRNFQQDYIQYPIGLERRMEWLWDQSLTEGLTKEQVQDGLQQLADWVSTTEKAAPRQGVWERY